MHWPFDRYVWYLSKYIDCCLGEDLGNQSGAACSVDVHDDSLTEIVLENQVLVGWLDAVFLLQVATDSWLEVGIVEEVLVVDSNVVDDGWLEAGFIQVFELGVEEKGLLEVRMLELDFSSDRWREVGVVEEDVVQVFAAGTVVSACWVEGDGKEDQDDVEDFFPSATWENVGIESTEGIASSFSVIVLNKVL